MTKKLPHFNWDVNPKSTDKRVEQQVKLLLRRRKMKAKEKLSECCKAPVSDSIYYWICSKCNKACDLANLPAQVKTNTWQDTVLRTYYSQEGDIDRYLLKQAEISFKICYNQALIDVRD